MFSTSKYRLTISLAWLVAVTWTLVVGASMIWNLYVDEQETMGTAYAEAKANINKDNTLRRWASDHGGVYVPITETQKSVPWLSHVPGRDVTITDGRQLTLLNPATVVRQMMDRYSEDYGVRGRITGLRNLNPANAPDPWEKVQLEAFTRGEKNEVWEVADIAGQSYLRYLRAMVMVPGCEKCHAILGYKLGDMRGATGLNLPLAPYYAQINLARRNLGITHGTIWLLGLVGIGWSSSLARRREQEMLQAKVIIDSSTDAIITKSSSGVITSWNAGAEALFGFTAAEAINNSIRILLPPDRLHEDETIVECILRGEKIENFETKRRCKDGRLIDVSATISPLADEQGKVIGTSNIVRDITKRKRAEEALRDSEHKLESMFQTIVEGVLTVDLTGQITYANQAALNILNIGKDEITNKYYQSTEWRQVDELGNPYPQDQLPLAIVLREKRSVENIQHGIIAEDGSLKWLSVNAAPLFDAAGNLSGAIASFRDFTDVKKREAEAIQLREQIAQATKMESVGHLTAGIAHDFNNILGAMMGYTELSQHMLATGDTGAIARYQEEVLTAGNRAKELIAQMLTFSRLSPELAGVQAPVTQLTTIVKEVVALLRSTIPSTVDLNYRIDDENLNARIQPVHLHQILLNLGVNARDALGEYGKIDITLSKRNSDHMLCSSCNTLYTGDFAQITVKDSGSGIPTHILKKIFDPFFTTKGVGKGTGMGLSVVHGLVHAQGGHIVVETGAEGGTTVSILLPLASSAVLNSEPVEAATVPNIKGARIMVVDDESALSSMLYEFFTAQGAQTVAFTSPIKALEAFMQNPDSIDLVVTDEAMPGISGMLLAEKLLKIKPGLPIILCTGYSDRATPEAVAKIGVAGFFYKPLNVNELLHKIQTLLEGKGRGAETHV